MTALDDCIRRADLTDLDAQLARIELASLRERAEQVDRLRLALGHLDSILAAWQQDGLSQIMYAIRIAREWREQMNNKQQIDLLDQWHERI